MCCRVSYLARAAHNMHRFYIIDLNGYALNEKKNIHTAAQLSKNFSCVSEKTLEAKKKNLTGVA